MANSSDTWMKWAPCNYHTNPIDRQSPEICCRFIPVLQDQAIRFTLRAVCSTADFPPIVSVGNCSLMANSSDTWMKWAPCNYHTNTINGQSPEICSRFPPIGPGNKVYITWCSAAEKFLLQVCGGNCSLMAKRGHARKHWAICNNL